MTRESDRTSWLTGVVGETGGEAGMALVPFFPGHKRDASRAWPVLAPDPQGGALCPSSFIHSSGTDRDILQAGPGAGHWRHAES